MDDDASRAARRPGVETLCRASVRVGPTETWYTTWGRGSPVVVFLRESLGRAPATWLGSIAEARSRLLFPEVPRGVDAEGFSAWFSDFLDGLGLDCVSVAADSGFEPLLRAALVDLGGRIEGSPTWVHPPGPRLNPPASHT